MSSSTPPEAASGAHAADSAIDPVHIESPAPAADTRASAGDLLSTEDFSSLPLEPLAASDVGAISRAHMGAVDLLVLEHRGATAVVSEFGAQVLTWTPAHENREVLFTSSQAVFDSSTAIRGGIPVCWPWFGPAAEPQHGWARLSRWTVETTTATEAAALVSLSLQHSGGRVDLTVCLDDGLEIELRNGTNPQLDIAPTAALHTYLRVGDVSQTTVTGITEAPLGVPATGIDRVYNLAAPVDDPTAAPADNAAAKHTDAAAEPAIHIHDTAFARTIGLRTNASDAVIWNPAKSLADTTPEAHRGFVCVEPARISRPLAAGDTLRMRLTVEPAG